ncbi:MAG: hypothetical protein AMXMBFR53_33620 [Gemmatimonadota bacterium]
MVKVVLPWQLRDLTGGAGTVGLDEPVETVGGALEALRARHPGVWDRICTETRELRPHVNVFVGRDDIRWTGGLATPVDDGAEVIILPSVSGG